MGLLKIQCPSAEDTSGLEKDSLTKAYYYYWLLKCFDLIETVFFVLRKKDRQVSLLHVHHHVSMILIPYLMGKYFPSIHGVVIGIINTFVHFIMYLYYLYTVWIKHNIWWKKYITILQIVSIFT